MRIAPNHPRLRVVALTCFTFAAVWLWQGKLLLSAASGLLSGLSVIVVLLAVAVGIAFWQLSHDQRAGIVFDAKGLLFNLGSSSAFVAWENIAAVGVCHRRDSLFALGSSTQLGIRLHSVEPYIQSYEERLPAAQGPLARALRFVQRRLQRFARPIGSVLPRRLARQRARTGYDLLVPEALLGRTTAGFVQLVETYLHAPEQRAALARSL